MPSKSGSSSSRLVAAAEELLEAAGAESATENQKKMVTGLESLKASMDAKLNTIQDHMGNKVGEIDKRLETMSEAITSMKAEGKMQRLAFAISNADLNSFKYYSLENESYYNNVAESTDLVRRILFSFRRNFGNYIPKGSMKYFDAYTSKNNEQLVLENNKAFHDALADQIHQLTGQKPRIEKEGERYVIYYS